LSYRQVTQRRDSSRLASGFVLRSAPGFPAFPVRLAQEIFLRAAEHLPGDRPVTLWDPCCGSGYLTTVLGLTCRSKLLRVVCSDIEPAAVELARQNLALLSLSGLAAREAELREKAASLAKEGYLLAADAARALAAELKVAGGDLPALAAVADVRSPQALRAILPEPPPDVVVTDLPYGDQTQWRGASAGAEDPVREVAQSLARVLPARSVVAICTRSRKVSLQGHRSALLERFKVGLRSVMLVRAGDVPL
jgi:23S rRNA G2445 N2-methylase RlmL